MHEQQSSKLLLLTAWCVARTSITAADRVCHRHFYINNLSSITFSYIALELTNADEPFVTFRQPCGHFPSRIMSPSFDQYQVILLGDRGT